MQVETFPDPVVCGVYMLFKNQRLVYVGRSESCFARIHMHRTSGRDFDYATVTALPKHDSLWVEQELIRVMDPSGNHRGRPSVAVVEHAAEQVSGQGPQERNQEAVRRVFAEVDGSRASAEAPAGNRRFEPGVLYSVKDVVAMCQVCRSKIYMEMKAGRLPFTKIGKSTRFLGSDVLTWLGFAVGV